MLSDPATGTSTEIQGLDAFPADERPTTREVNIVHLAWDVMVGLGTALFLLVALVRARAGCSAATCRARSGSWRAAAVAGVASVLAMEAGWVVTEVGRQPWIVFDYMKVEDAATGNEGVWLTFLVVVGRLRRGRGARSSWILRVMARRFRAGDEPGSTTRPTDRANPTSSATRRGVS